MQTDSLLQTRGALIQHGPASDRVYLMKLSGFDVPRTIRIMEELALRNGYSKLFAKIPAQVQGWFQARGFEVEARVPGMYCGHEDGCFMAKYPHAGRADIRRPNTVREVLRTAKKQKPQAARALPADFGLRRMTPKDADEMSTFYGQVFETYPFPISDPDYIRSTMKTHVRYFGVFGDQGGLVALSSAEMDVAGGNAEMTDFATDPEFRGHGLAGILLTRMEKNMRQAGIRTAFTIARAHAAGVNIVFARRGYAFAGTLPNNTQIKGDLESMNVWYKRLSKPAR